MKNTCLLLIFSLFHYKAFRLFSQTGVIVEVDIDNLYYSEPGCGDCFSGPDPVWQIRGILNSNNYDWNTSQADIGSCGWRGITNYGFINPTGSHIHNSITIQLNGYEDDNWLCGGHDGNCGGYATVSSVSQIGLHPPCQWNYFTGFRSCTSDGTTSTYGVQWSYFWQYDFAPTITVHPPSSFVLCASDPSPVLSVSTNYIFGRRVGRFFQWQVSTSTDCSGATGWTNIPGATDTFYIPPVISGTRLYRCLVTSNCSPDFSSYTTVSPCVRVTRHPASPTPAIVSSACGTGILPNLAVNFSALMPPSPGAVADVVGYQWSVSPSGGVTISAPNASSTNITFSNPGTYVVTLTYLDGCPGADATSQCTVVVSQPDCDFIYVDWDNGNDANLGGPDAPVKTVFRALQLVSGSRNYIRVKNATYTETQRWNLLSGVTIEGGYVISGGVWKKQSGGAAIFNFTASTSGTSPTVTEVDPNTRHLIAIAANGVSNWRLIDIQVNTANVTGTSTSGRGSSNYALWMTNCSNYTVLRCQFSAGAGSGGSDGSGYANNGGAGGSGQGWGGSGANGNGDPGGGFPGAPGSPGTGGPPYGPPWGNGGAGGAGYDVCGGASGGCPGSSPGCNGAHGQNGFPGENGRSWNPGDRPSHSVANTVYFIPAGQAEAGGGGGGGGQGGGGGGSRGGRVACVNCTGYNGGQGGTGGAGGGGGLGGFGGGGSFGLWRTNSNTGATILQSTFNGGTVGVGGNGALGQPGFAGASGGSGSCNSCVAGSRCSGNGGAGGPGGTGGRGRDGANGISASVVTDGGISSITGGFSPPVTVTVHYDNNRLCSNSEIQIQRSAAGVWSLPAGASFVNDIDNSTASTGVGDNLIKIYFNNASSLPAAHDISTNGTTFSEYLIQRTNRTLPTITVTPSSVCTGAGATITLSATSWGTEVQYDWRIFTTNAETPLITATTASPVVDVSTLVPGTYNVRFRVRESCCGWSIPVYSSFTVVADPTPPSPLTRIPDNDVCQGTPITVAPATGSTGGAGLCQYHYRFFDPGTSSWTAWSPTLTTWTPTGPGTAVVEAKRVCTGPGCDESAAVSVTWNVVAPCSGVPNPGNTVASSTSVCPSAPFNLTIAYPSLCGDFTYQWQYSTDDGTTWQNFGTNTATIVGHTQTQETMYRCLVTCTNSMLSNYSIPVTVSMNSACNCNLCIPTTNCSSGNAITGVNFGTISHSSGCVGASGYQMYGGPSTTVHLTMTYPITIQTGSAPQGVAVWIDWNADGDYIDPGELVLTGYTGSPSAIYSGNITIPSTANIGFTKMRVRSRANAVPSDPCANYPLGETEDYCLEILPFTCTWTGAVPAGPVWGHWTNPNNWDCGFVPTIFTNVIIPNIPIQPAIVLADGNAYNVTMHDGAKLLINNSNRRLNVANNWNGGSTTNAFVNHSTGPVRMLASDGYGVITGHTNFHTLEIASASGTIAIPSGNVTVRNAVRLMSGTLNTFGNLTLEALNAPAHSAAIVDNFSAGFTGTMVGNVKAQRRVPRFGNMYLGSPVNNGTIADMAANIPGGLNHNGIGTDGSYYIADPTCSYASPASPLARIMQYDETAPTTCQFNGWQIRLTGTTQNGRGYLVMQPSATSNPFYQFTGIANTGNITTPITRTASNATATQGMNLLSNPYPSGIDLDAFYAANSGQIGAVANLYNGTTFVPVQMNDGTPSLIASFQGFIVNKLTVGSGTVTFNQGMRVTGNTLAFTDAMNVPHKLEVEVVGSDAEHRDVTYVYFGEGVSDGFDLREDGYKYYSAEGYPTLYTLAEGTAWPVSVNGLNVQTRVSEVPVGLHPGAAGRFVFTLRGGDRLPAGLVCYLVDRKEQKEVRVGSETSYVFDINGAETRDRFVLKFRREVAVTEQAMVAPEVPQVKETVAGTEADRAWVSGGRVYLSLGRDVPGRLTLRLVDMSGKVVWTDAIQNAVRGVYDLGELDVAAGLYILNWSDGSGTQSARLPLGLAK